MLHPFAIFVGGDSTFTGGMKTENSSPSGANLCQSEVLRRSGDTIFCVLPDASLAGLGLLFWATAEAAVCAAFACRNSQGGTGASICQMPRRSWRAVCSEAT